MDYHESRKIHISLNVCFSIIFFCYRLHCANILQKIYVIYLQNCHELVGLNLNTLNPAI